jgi:hypothetical protein
MLFLVFAIGLFLLARRLRPQWVAWKNRSAAERSFTVRFATFASVLAFIFLAAAVHLPPLGCVLLTVPIFLTATTLGKWWQNSRERLRRAADVDSNFERARRIN